MGNTVWYRGIEESSPSGDPLPLYGTPAANGNELLFPTTGNFAAASVGGGGPDQTDGKLSFMIEAKAGNFLTSFSIEENGLAVLDAPFGGDSFVSISGFAVVKVAEISGAPVNLPAFNMLFSTSPLGGQYQLSVIGGSSFTTGWSSGAVVPLPQNTTKVNVTLNNNLFAATTGQGTRAFVDKKAFEIDVDTVVPEPATGALVMAGLLASCGLLRKRS